MVCDTCKSRPNRDMVLFAEKDVLLNPPFTRRRPRLPGAFVPAFVTPQRELAVPTNTLAEQPGEKLQKAADRVLLHVYASPAVVVNQAGAIVCISGRTGKYLEPAAGKADWNFHAMVREGLRMQIADALKQVALQRETVQLHGLKMKVPGAVRSVDVTVQPLREPARQRCRTSAERSDQQPAIPEPAGRRAGDLAHTGVQREADRDQRRPQPDGAHHALPSAGQRDRRCRHHVCRYRRRRAACLCSLSAATGPCAR